MIEPLPFRGPGTGVGLQLGTCAPQIRIFRIYKLLLPESYLCLPPNAKYMCTSLLKVPKRSALLSILFLLQKDTPSNPKEWLSSVYPLNRSSQNGSQVSIKGKLHHEVLTSLDTLMAISLQRPQPRERRSSPFFSTWTCSFPDETEPATHRISGRVLLCVFP